MHFTKMHGLGNDFIVINAIEQSIYLSSDNIRFLSNRKCGIGFDQLLIIESSHDSQADFHCKIYNADGTEVNQCGNGIRCVAHFIYTKKLVNKNNICISTKTNSVVLFRKDADNISADMGEPIFDPNLIPFYMPTYQKIYVLFLPMQTILCGIVSIGNPHCIILVESVKLAPVIEWGSVIENHHCFPNQVNVSFMQVYDRNNIEIRVYERGVGETQACGSAACAAVAVGIKQGLLCESVKVKLPGGVLLINWKGLGHTLRMVGSASYVYDGYIHTPIV